MVAYFDAKIVMSEIIFWINLNILNWLPECMQESYQWNIVTSYNILQLLDNDNEKRATCISIQHSIQWYIPQPRNERLGKTVNGFHCT